MAFPVSTFQLQERYHDTSTPSGKLVFQVIAAVAEFERDIIVERDKAGMANAKRKGKHVGRPPISDHILEDARQLRKEGKYWREIGKALGVDSSEVRKRLANRK
ncbi:recombinase family protein [Thermodesulfobacteriota bacterium]